MAQDQTAGRPGEGGAEDDDRPHVLLIEDEPNIIEAMRFILGRDGWRVSVHSDGATAVETVTKLMPDAIVLDVMLPTRNGFDVLRDLRSTPSTAPLPVLMLTAKGQSKDRERAVGLGVSAFMTKPFANAEMIAQLRSLVDR